MVCILTSFSLLDFECEVECSDGEVDSLWVHTAYLTEQVQNKAAFITYQARQQLRDPRKQRVQPPFTYSSHNNTRNGIPLTDKE